MRLFDFAKARANEYHFSRRFQSALATLKKYEDLSDHETDAFRFVMQNASVVRIRFDEAQNALKRKEIRPMVFSWAREIMKDGKEHLSIDSILTEIDRFDESAMLTPGEFFSLSAIIISESAKTFITALEKTLSIQRAVIDAESWMEKDSPIPLDMDPVYFLGHALMIAAEKGDVNKRTQALDYLHGIGKGEDEVVNIACDGISDLLLRLTNAVSIIHTVIDIDWMEAYQKISHIEKTLMSDPSGIYPSMDEESKSAVRREIEVIHRFTRVPQRRIASAAVQLSQTVESGVAQILYTDEGREKLLKALYAENRYLPRMIPDPKGHRIILAISSAFIILSLIAICALSPVYLIILLPVIFQLSEDIVRRICHRFASARPLLSMNMDLISEENRTLVVIPALLSSVKTVNEAIGNLASYGAHENSENIDFLLLGDFKDSKQEHLENDCEIIREAQKGIHEMNLGCTRQKYFFLIRNRTYNETDGIYMGHERKRGALMDLNRLLLGYGNRFSADTDDAKSLVNRYKYVLTVDMDTKILPGTIRKMIGAISHPLNSEYAVLQPRMENTGFVKPNLFSAWMAGFGGTDHYDICASDFYQDMTGEGLFSGKGIYNIKTFFDKTAEAFQENTILSHDMIEGVLSKCGYLGNVVMYESFPETTNAYYKRLDRWTRGDWQLMLYLFGRIRLNALGRYKIISNLVRSLKSASFLSGIVLAVWSNQIWLLLGLLAIHFLPFFLSGIGALKPCLIKLLLLPVTAYTEAKAALTALVRTYITKKKRLEWVTAAEGAKTGKTVNYAGIIAAILLMPGLFSSNMWIFSVLLGACFAIGKDFVDSFDRLFRSENIEASDYTYLTDLSKRMWRYFEKHVPLTGTGFPPDNVQIDPPVGIQSRTSPTNIGMYLISVISAREMGLIEQEELLSRIKQTLSSLKTLETWHGLLYNWYDIHTLKPAHPKYVSSVDAGNLMAAFVLVRNYIKEDEPLLSDEFNELIRKMEIEKLFNPKRKLFRIGIDAENNRLSASHYDLFSSEARILSFTAMAEKGIPVSHWKQLARPFFFHKGKSALYSWSGTMFEYMMPDLIMPSAFGSLMKNSMKSAVDLQIKKAREGIWGISEAGYAAFDQMLNYQYKAFGLRRLALSGEASECVFAPYAVLLALKHAFLKGMDALKAMQEAGLKGEYGFYESIDFSSENKPRIVYSYMSHHQGMGFAAVCNLLTGNALQKHFLNHPNEQALTPLLNEKPFLMPVYKRLFKKAEHAFFKKEDSFFQKDAYARHINASNRDGHLLFSSNALAYFETTGRSFLKKDGVFLNLFSHDACDMKSTLLPEIQDASGKAKIVQCRFDTACALYDYQTKSGKYKAICTLNPITGELLIKVILKNEMDAETEVSIKHAFRLSLNNEEMNYAHPVFSDLFVKTERIDDFSLEHARKNRDTLEYTDYLYHRTDGESVYSDEEKKTHGKYACILRKMTLSPRGKAEIFFSVSLEKEKKTIFENLNSALFDRAQTLLMGQMNAHIQFSGLSAYEYRSADRKTINLFSFMPKERKGALTKSTLWPLGLSGEGSILLVRLKSAGDLVFLRKTVKFQAFLRSANVSTTVVILKVRETEYFTPLKDAAVNHLLSGHLSECFQKEGGAMIFDADDLDSLQIKLLEAMDILKDQNRMSFEKQTEKALPRLKTLSSFDENKLIGFNAFGGFLKDSNAYQINVTEQSKPPRRWSNFLANDAFGAIVSDIGVSSIFFENSRMGRITAFENNLDENKKSVGIEIILSGKQISLFPGANPNGKYAVTHDTGKSMYSVKTEEVYADTTVCVHPNKPALLISAMVENRDDNDLPLTLKADVQFLMGVDDRDLKFTSRMACENTTFAYGCAGFSVCAGWIEEEAEKGGMELSAIVKMHEKRRLSFLITAADTDAEASALFKNFNAVETLSDSEEYWKRKMNAITVSTGNILRDKIANGFMKYQTIASRYFARFGPYQPGGAFGMRDQLQDLMSIVYFDKALSKNHILLAASRQFEKGDGLHWWHMPANGVRTKISDDVLFLALVTAKYIEETGDEGILAQKIPYLKSREIPEGETDLYASFEKTDYSETLYEHILKAFRYTERRGAHGLLLMGSGDWNDGMNRVGAEGRGESVWLSMFWVYAANVFKGYAGQKDRQYLEKALDEIREAIEKHAWDGKWYLRAFDDNGKKLGSSENEECRIDLLSQTWAVLSGLDHERAETAIKSVEEHLIDKEASIVRLLHPPFTRKDMNPGYIAAYPPGTRENGGQYTHAVTWLVKAYAKLGYAKKAWEIFDMLIPIERTRTLEDAHKYGGEPYVVSADIRDSADAKGECGWTWYTGAAAWATRVLHEDLLGLEIKGDKVRIKPLLTDEMDEGKITLQYGCAKYVLIGRSDTDEKDEFIKLIDDGNVHTHIFPSRK